MSEITFQDGCPPKFKMQYPVCDGNFPPAKGSTLVNPKVGIQHGLAAPTFPGDEGYEAELFEVIAVRMSVLRGEMPDWFFDRYGIDTELTPVIKREVDFTSELMGVTAPEALADLVRMDSPTDLGRILVRHLAGEGVKIKGDHSAHTPFIETNSRSLDLLGAATHASLVAAFEAKYYFGRPRPAERARTIEPNLSEALFSQYPHPHHPAYPAGHGAAAGATVRALEEAFELTKAQLDMVIQSAAQFAMARTHAGMHYANDNYAGMLLGYEAADQLFTAPNTLAD